MSDTTAAGTTVDGVANRLFAVFRPRHGSPPQWPARDVTLGQLKTLFMLRLQGPLSIGRIADEFGIGAAAASGYVERIERHGLVERKHRSDDRRVVECHLTGAGGRLLDALAGIQLNAFRRALAVLKPAELAEFDRLLSLMAERTGQPEARA